MLTALGAGSTIVGSAFFISAPGQPMKRIQITRATVCGGVTVSAGDVIDASDRDADFLIAIGKARRAAVDAIQDAQESDPAGSEQDDEGAAPRRRGRPRKVSA